MSLTPTSRSLPKEFFQKLPIGRKLIGRWRGIRCGRDYWIGVCVLNEEVCVTQAGKEVPVTADFILCKRSEMSMREVMHFRDQRQKDVLVLTFNGLSAKGYPRFTYQFK